jgi:enterochelin esterase-like enzyme
LLFAGGATITIGAAAIKTLGWTRMLHEIGVVNSPDHHVPAVGPKVVRDRFDSVHMGEPVRYGIAIPEAPIGIVVCLHGRNNDYSMAFDSIHLHDVAASLDARLVVVSVDGGPDSYWHKRESGIDPQQMIQEDLLPRVDARVGSTLPRALIGWSMGGYGALVTAQSHAAEYAAVVAASPAIFTSFDEAPKGAFDNEKDFQEYDVFAEVGALDDMTVRVDCGTNDPFIDNARLFASRLRDPLGAFSRGFHDTAYWRSVAPAQISSIVDAIQTARG